MSTELNITKPKMTFADTLRFTAYAYAKLLYMRDRGPTEVAGYATTSTDDPLLVTDIRLIQQKCTSVDFDFDTNDMIEDVEQTLDDGLCPWMTHNILCHSHPGNDPSPSPTDEKNFQKAFSHPHWSIMFIIAKNNTAYCRLKINIGPGVEKQLKVEVDFSQEFQASDHLKWDKEYKDKVMKKVFRMTGKEGIKADSATNFPDDDNLCYNEQEDRWQAFHEAQQAELDRNSETAIEIDDEIDFDCHWDSDGNVLYWDDYKSMWYLYNPDGRWFKENLGPEERMGNVIEIVAPTEPWATQVMAWAKRHADERLLAMGM